MFQFLRRVSGSFLPRPDRPWRDDATSHAPTIGRKRRYSVTEQENGDSPSSTSKRSKNEPVKPDSESERETTQPPIEGQDVKEVTKGVKEVDLEDKGEAEGSSSIRPEGVPLPDSPSGSPAPAPVSDEVNDEEHPDDQSSVASSSPENNTAEDDVEETQSTNDDTVANDSEITPAIESALHDTPDTLEVEA